MLRLKLRGVLREQGIGVVELADAIGMDSRRVSDALLGRRELAPAGRTEVEAFLRSQGVTAAGIWDRVEEGAARSDAAPDGSAIGLLEVMQEAGISTYALGRASGVSPTYINYVTRGLKRPALKVRRRIEAGLGKLHVAFNGHLWDPMRGKENEMNPWLNPPVLGATALARFGLKRNPFVNEIKGRQDLFESKGFRDLEESVIDGVTDRAFLAVTAPSGSGKTVAVRSAMEKLRRRPSIRFVCPEHRRVEKYDIGLIYDALVTDLGDKGAIFAPRETKARRVKEALIRATVEEGRTVVLVVEEADRLSDQALKELKRLWEITDPKLAFEAALAILLVGKEALKRRLGNNVELEEVRSRCHVLTLGWKRRDLDGYIDWKFERAGGSAGKVLTPEGRKAVLTECRENLRPIYVNNLLACALAQAYELGDERVDEAHVRAAIEACWGGRGGAGGVREEVEAAATK